MHEHISHLPYQLNEISHEENTVQDLAAYDSLSSALDSLIKEKNSIILAIDGNCGCGKTTLARKLASWFDSQIISMDDFFLPFQLRSPKRLAEPGGNIHYERFLTEIVQSLSSDRTSIFSYHKFDCSTGTMDEKITVTPKPLLIIEGSYSMHPLFQHLYDYSIFVTCPPKIQEERIRNRNGEEVLQVFKERWIPMENKYFQHFDIKKSCSHILETG